MRKSPPFFKGTLREWKGTKRRQFRDVLKAVDVFRHGCAYVPGFVDHEPPLSKALEGWKDAMSVKNWK
jgi:hypothetical protein